MFKKKNTHDNYDWAYYANYHRSRISNRIIKRKYLPVESCFGGFASYDFKFLINSNCTYQSFDNAFINVNGFEPFANQYRLYDTCEHIPFNFCITNQGGRIAISSNTHAFYGTNDRHGRPRR